MFSLNVTTVYGKREEQRRVMAREDEAIIRKNGRNILKKISSMIWVKMKRMNENQKLVSAYDPVNDRLQIK